MSNKESREGSCLCGSVELNMTNTDSGFGACHCSMCRGWGGGPLLSVKCNLVIKSGQEFISVFTSSDWAERGFCKKCGSHLYYKLKGSSDYQAAVGLFEDINSLSFKKQLFIDIKPDHYSFSNETQNLTEAEAIEMHAPQS